MNLEKAKKMLEITPEEISSLQKYQGYRHTVINTLCNLNPETYKQLEKSGWKMAESNNEIKSAIKSLKKLMIHIIMNN